VVVVQQPQHHHQHHQHHHQPSLMMGQAVGGNGGHPFNEVNMSGVKEIKLFGGQYLDAIKLEFNDGKKSKKHGGDGGKKHKVKVDHHHLKGIGFRSGAWMDAITIHTNKGITHVGGHGGNEHPIQHVPHGYHLVGFHGRAGQYVDQLQPVWAPRH